MLSPDLPTAERARGLGSVIRLDKPAIIETPYPHLIVDGFLQPDIFRALTESYPQIETGEPTEGSPKSLFAGDEGYDEHIRSHPAWSALHEAVHSDGFIAYVHELFEPVWKRDGCRVDFSKARIVECYEDREEKKSKSLKQIRFGRDDLWCRLDIFKAWAGYRRPIHLDHRRRIISMLVYFDDPQDIGMEGGGLALHRTHADLQLFRSVGVDQIPLRYSHLRPRLVQPKTVLPKPNRMVVFPCTRDSWHSVPRITALKKARKYVHIVMSSSVDVWA